MAREVLTIAGAVVGAFFGQPQLGMAIGAAVGGLVDPEVIKAPSVRDVANQTAREGVPCPLYDGTCGGAGNLVYCSEPEFITVRERQGKGGPVVESERILLTFAIRVGAALQDGPGVRNGIPNLIKVWEDEKLVYDVSPTSQILEESAEYAQGFTYYPGDETQLPDPDLEALLGATNCVAYRGRALFVRKRFDATDRRGTPPNYRFEVSTGGAEVLAVALATDRRHYSGNPLDLDVAGANIGFPSGTNLVRMNPNGLYVAGSNKGATLGDALFTWFKYDRDTDTWSQMPDPDVMPDRGPLGMAWSNSGDHLAIVQSVAPRLIVYRRVGDTLVKIDDPETLPTTSPNNVCWREDDLQLVLGMASTINPIRCYDFVPDTDQLLNFRTTENSPAGTPGVYVSFQPGGATRYVAASGPDAVMVFDTTDSPMRLAAYVYDLGDADGEAGVHWDASGGYVISVGRNNGPNFVRIWDFDGSVINSETLAYVGPAQDQPTAPVDSAMTPEGTYLAIAETLATPFLLDFTGPLPPTGTEVAVPANSGSTNTLSWAAIPDVPQIEAGVTTLESVIKATGRRCGIADDTWNLPGASAKQIKGVVVASQGYTGQDFVNALRVAFPSDGACFDSQIHILLRGGAVDFALDDDFRVEEGDDNEQGEMLRNGDDQRKAQLRRPAKINLMFPNANLGYTFTKANAPNYGAPEGVVTEVTVEVPCVLEETTEAPQLADVLDKISRAEADGELVRVFPDYLAAKAVPGTIVRLTDGALQRRLRVQSIRTGDGTRRLGLWVDRQHAYTSQATAPAGPGWPTPPASLVGQTVAQVLNLPALVDDNDRLGVYVGISGDTGTAWYGSRIEYRVQGMTAWNDLGVFTQRTIMGTLLEDLPGASPYWPDWVNPLRVLLLHDDDLESLTELEWLSEMGALAIAREDGTAEIIQSQNAQSDGNREWTLTNHQRGRLDTSSASHDAAARVVFLDSCIFVPLPSSVIGQTLEFRFTALGSSPETASTQTIEWNPVYIQREWSPTLLTLERAGGTISGEFSPRNRFGTDTNPIASVNLTGYRVTLTDGVTTVVLPDTLATTFSTSDSPFTGDVTVTVEAVNRYTGPGPGTSEII